MRLRLPLAPEPQVKPETLPVSVLFFFGCLFLIRIWRLRRAPDGVSGALPP